MSFYQFSSYLDEIPELEKMFSGSKPKQGESTSTDDLIDMAKNKGIKTPKKY